MIARKHELIVGLWLISSQPGSALTARCSWFSTTCSLCRSSATISMCASKWGAADHDGSNIILRVNFPAWLTSSWSTYVRAGYFTTSTHPLMINNHQLIIGGSRWSEADHNDNAYAWLNLSINYAARCWYYVAAHHGDNFHAWKTKLVVGHLSQLD